ncbi:hypothetical protein OROMI_003771 [Orobanche minor]
MLKVMHYVEIINRGWVLFSYLKKDDRALKGARVPTPAEQITRRGPEILRELQTGTFVHHPRSKGKGQMSTEASEEYDLVECMCSLKTTQLEICDASVLFGLKYKSLKMKFTSLFCVDY